MKENLIQVFTEYTNTLEQQIAALEARIAHLEELLAAKEGDVTPVEGVLSDEEHVDFPINELENDNIEIVLDPSSDEEVVDTSVTETTIENEVKEDVPTEPIIEEPIVVEPVKDESTKEVSVIEVAEPVVEQTPDTHIEEKTTEVIVEDKPAKVEATKIASAPTAISAPTVTDIRQAISLGDRFLFQRELFAGNGELMQQTLDHLNKLDTLDEALEYLSDNFDWEKDSNTFSLFEIVLKRRFN